MYIKPVQTLLQCGECGGEGMLPKSGQGAQLIEECEPCGGFGYYGIHPHLPWPPSTSLALRKELYLRARYVTGLPLFPE